MFLERYATFKIAPGHIGFYSTGPKGIIEKRILFQHMSDESYNLAFGDWDHIHNDLNDLTRSNNQDVEKVLTTVALEVLSFLEQNPQAKIYIRGSSPGRTRKYQMGIASHITFLEKQFSVLGYVSETQNRMDDIGHPGWERFRSGVNYKRLLIYRKKN